MKLDTILKRLSLRTIKSNTPGMILVPILYANELKRKALELERKNVLYGKKIREAKKDVLALYYSIRINKEEK
jgi:hypothetical protein